MRAVHALHLVRISEQLVSISGIDLARSSDDVSLRKHLETNSHAIDPSSPAGRGDAELGIDVPTKAF